MKYLEQHPVIMIVIGVLGISMSAIFVKYSAAPSEVTAACRLLWTVLLMTPVVVAKRDVRQELCRVSAKDFLLSALSGIFLAFHFAWWFESLNHTSVASSTTIVCTEVIWVALGYCLFLKGSLSAKAVLAILVTFFGSVLIAWSDSSTGASHLRGDVLALLAAIAVAAYTLLGRILRSRLSTTVYTYIVYTACAVSLVVMCAHNAYTLSDFTASPIIVGLLLSVFSTILGHSIFSWCLKYFSPAFVSASKLCEPVAAGVFAAILFGELPSLLQLTGCAVILGGVLYYSRLEAKQ